MLALGFYGPRPSGPTGTLSCINVDDEATGQSVEVQFLGHLKDCNRAVVTHNICAVILLSLAAYCIYQGVSTDTLPLIAIGSVGAAAILVKLDFDRRYWGMKLPALKSALQGLGLYNSKPEFRAWLKLHLGTERVLHPANLLSKYTLYSQQPEV